MKTSANEIRIDFMRLAWIVLIFLISFEIFLVIIDITINFAKLIDYGPIRRLCNVAREDSFATWFMVTQTFVAGLVLWFIYYLSCNIKETKRFHKIAWFILALFFTFMAADDGALIHERLGSTFKLVIKDMEGSEGMFSMMFSIFPSYAWQMIVLPFFISMGIFILFFLWRVFGHGRSLMMVVVALGCFTLAIIIDFIEGLDRQASLNVLQWIKESYGLRTYTVSHLAKVFEEFLEMLGISIFLSVFIAHLSSMTKNSFTIRFDSNKPSA